jgi:hypothetical protein
MKLFQKNHCFDSQKERKKLTTENEWLKTKHYHLFNENESFKQEMQNSKVGHVENDSSNPSNSYIETAFVKADQCLQKRISLNTNF